jgi:TonB family protein
MATGAHVQSGERVSRRRRWRYRVQAPLDVTVLRSGIPDTLPGRSVNLCEGGVAAVLAGELLPGEAVGIEIQLPMAADTLRTRALVRHHDKLRYGMEFVGLSPGQQAAIRAWAGKANAQLEVDARPTIAIEEKASDADGSNGDEPPPPAGKPRRRRWIFALLAAAILLAIFLWRWHSGWKDLESGLHQNEKVLAQPQVHVSADVMQKLVTHRVDPEYPAAARPGKLQGIIVLDVVVGRDGSVLDVHALNGPNILAQPAMDALRWWRFEPYRVDGQAVVVGTTVAVEFRP